MSTTIPNTESTNRTESNHSKFDLPTQSRQLHYWLDEQPNFRTATRTVRRRNNLESFDENQDNGSVDVETRFTDVSTDVRSIERERAKTYYLSPEVDVDTRACYNSQAEVCNAWESKKFPAHNTSTIRQDAADLSGAHLYTWSTESGARGRRGFRRPRGSRTDDDRDSVINYEAIQHPHGHGIIQHYDTIAAIRTRSGLVINNEQDGAAGFARVTQPDDHHSTLPLTGMAQILSDADTDETLYDIESVQRDKVDIIYEMETDPIGGHEIVTGVRPSHSNRDFDTIYCDLSGGGAIVLMYDSTANDRNERKVGFYAPPEDARHIETVSDAVDMVQPEEVQYSRLDITPADEYAGSAKFSNPSLEGETIIRQGEWYLIPMPEGFEPDNPVYKPLPTPNRKNDWTFPTDADDYLNVTDILDTLPRECPECGNTSFSIDSDEPTLECDGCNSRFAYGDAPISNFVTEQLKDDYGFVRDDILDSHQPRDLSVDMDENKMFVRGTFRHLDNEHQMVNLRERWHLAVENTEDMTVFNLSPDYGTGVGGAAYRVE